MKKCDLCDTLFKGKDFPVYDENWKRQRGIISCGCHIAVPNETYSDYKKSGFSDIDIQQNANLINNNEE